MMATWRLCKYGCNTEISWHTKLNKFVESDGTVHDRIRCESIRPNTNERVQESPVPITTRAQPAAAPPTQTLQKQEMKGDNWQIPREDWEKLSYLLSQISHNVALMVAHYDGLVETQRQMARLLTGPIDKNEEQAAEAERQYDQDKEDGAQWQ